LHLRTSAATISPSAHFNREEGFEQAKVSVPKKKEMLVLGSGLIFVVGCSPALCLLAPPFILLDLVVFDLFICINGNYFFWRKFAET
jgi:hypothetical protein